MSGVPLSRRKQSRFEAQHQFYKLHGNEWNTCIFMGECNMTILAIILALAVTLLTAELMEW